MSEHPPDSPVNVRELIKSEFSDRHFSTKQILQFFEFAHLPGHLKPISRKCAETAVDMVRSLPDSPELTTGLRKLLEAKDCFVRANLPEE